MRVSAARVCTVKIDVGDFVFTIEVKRKIRLSAL